MLPGLYIKALHHATVFPKWYKYDKEKEFEVSSDAAAIEGGKLLTKATGLSAKLMENRSKHIRFCEVNMWNPATATVGFNMDDMWPPRTAFLSNIEIGFDRAELVNFLNENNVAHSLGRRAAPAIEPMTPAAVVTLPPAEAPILHQKEAEQSTKHRIGNRTASILDAEIGEAKKLAINPDDKSSVWTELVKMAEKKIGCLLGMDGKDIKYQSGDGVLFFKKRSLNERMNRAATPLRRTTTHSTAPLSVNRRLKMTMNTLNNAAMQKGIHNANRHDSATPARR